MNLTTLRTPNRAPTTHESQLAWYCSSQKLTRDWLNRECGLNRRAALSSKEARQGAVQTFAKQDIRTFSDESLTKVEMVNSVSVLFDAGPYFVVYRVVPTFGLRVHPYLLYHRIFYHPKALPGTQVVALGLVPWGRRVSLHL